MGASNLFPSTVVPQAARLQAAPKATEQTIAPSIGISPQHTQAISQPITWGDIQANPGAYSAGGGYSGSSRGGSSQPLQPVTISPPSSSSGLTPKNSPTTQYNQAQQGINQLPAFIHSQLLSNAISQYNDPTTGQTFYAPGVLNNQNQIWVNGPGYSGPLSGSQVQVTQPTETITEGAKTLYSGNEQLAPLLQYSAKGTYEKEIKPTYFTNNGQTYYTFAPASDLITLNGNTYVNPFGALLNQQASTLSYQVYNSQTGSNDTYIFPATVSPQGTQITATISNGAASTSNPGLVYWNGYILPKYTGPQTLYFDNQPLNVNTARDYYDVLQTSSAGNVPVYNITNAQGSLKSFLESGKEFQTTIIPASQNQNSTSSIAAPSTPLNNPTPETAIQIAQLATTLGANNIPLTPSSIETLYESGLNTPDIIQSWYNSLTPDQKHQISNGATFTVDYNASTPKAINIIQAFGQGQPENPSTVVPTTISPGAYETAALASLTPTNPTAREFLLNELKNQAQQGYNNLISSAAQTGINGLIPNSQINIPRATWQDTEAVANSLGSNTSALFNYATSPNTYASDIAGLGLGINAASRYLYGSQSALSTLAAQQNQQTNNTLNNLNIPTNSPEAALIRVAAAPGALISTLNPQSSNTFSNQLSNNLNQIGESFSQGYNTPGAIQRVAPQLYTQANNLLSADQTGLTNYLNQNNNNYATLPIQVLAAMAQQYIKNLNTANTTTNPTAGLLPTAETYGLPIMVGLNPTAALNSGLFFGLSGAAGQIGANALFGKQTTPGALAQNTAANSLFGLEAGPLFAAAAPLIGGAASALPKSLQSVLGGSLLARSAANAAGLIGLTNLQSLISSGQPATPYEDVYSGLMGLSYTPIENQVRDLYALGSYGANRLIGQPATLTYETQPTLATENIGAALPNDEVVLKDILNKAGIPSEGLTSLEQRSIIASNPDLFPETIKELANIVIPSKAVTDYLRTRPTAIDQNDLNTLLKDANQYKPNMTYDEKIAAVSQIIGNNPINISLTKGFTLGNSFQYGEETVNNVIKQDLYKLFSHISPDAAIINSLSSEGKTEIKPTEKTGSRTQLISGQGFYNAPQETAYGQYAVSSGEEARLNNQIQPRITTIVQPFAKDLSIEDYVSSSARGQIIKNFNFDPKTFLDAMRTDPQLATTINAKILNFEYNDYLSKIGALGTSGRLYKQGRGELERISPVTGTLTGVTKVPDYIIKPNNLFANVPENLNFLKNIIPKNVYFNTIGLTTLTPTQVEDRALQLKKYYVNDFQGVSDENMLKALETNTPFIKDKINVIINTPEGILLVRGPDGAYTLPSTELDYNAKNPLDAALKNINADTKLKLSQNDLNYYNNYSSDIHSSQKSNAPYIENNNIYSTYQTDLSKLLNDKNIKFFNGNSNLQIDPKIQQILNTYNNPSILSTDQLEKLRNLYQKIQLTPEHESAMGIYSPMNKIDLKTLQKFNDQVAEILGVPKSKISFEVPDYAKSSEPQSENGQTGGAIIKMPGQPNILYINPEVDIGSQLSLLQEGINTNDIPKMTIIHENLHQLYDSMNLSDTNIAPEFPEAEATLADTYKNISSKDYIEEAAIRNITNNILLNRNNAPLILSKSGEIMPQPPEIVPGTQQTPAISYNGATPLNTQGTALSIVNTPSAQLSPYDYLTSTNQMNINNQIINALTNPQKYGSLLPELNNSLQNAYIQNQYLNDILNNYQQEIGRNPIFNYSAQGISLPTQQPPLQEIGGIFQQSPSLASIINNISSFAPDQLAYLFNTNPNIEDALKARLHSLENIVPTEKGLITSPYENRGSEITSESTIPNIIDYLSRYGVNLNILPYSAYQNLYQNGYINPAEFNRYTSNAIAYPGEGLYPPGYQTYQSAYQSYPSYQNQQFYKKNYPSNYQTTYPTIYPYNYPYTFPNPYNKPVVEPIPVPLYPYYARQPSNFNQIQIKSARRYAPSLIASLFPEKNSEFIKNYNNKFSGIDIRPILKQTG